MFVFQLQGFEGVVQGAGCAQLRQAAYDLICDFWVECRRGHTPGTSVMRADGTAGAWGVSRATSAATCGLLSAVCHDAWRQLRLAFAVFAFACTELGSLVLGCAAALWEPPRVPHR